MDLNTIYIVNGIGLVILACVAICNSTLLIRRDRGLTEWRLIILICAVCFFAEPLLYKFDGVKSDTVRVILIIGNNWIYIAGTLIAALWLRFLTIRMYGVAKKYHINVLLYCHVGVHAAMLVLNHFKPLFFYIDRLNMYQRGRYYIIIAITMMLPLIASVFMFAATLIRHRNTQSFNLMVLVLPVLGAYIAQIIHFGISLTWIAIAVGVMCITFFVLNEDKFHDALTGLYNRAYLDYFASTALSHRDAAYDGIMIDINSFKSINDNYGHAKGDEALKLTASAIKNACDNGSVLIRYAGDEFVVLTPLAQKTDPEDIIARINSELLAVCAGKDLPYSLTLSCGHDKLVSGDEVEEFMNRIDMAMLVNKRAFYSRNPGLERRRH